MKGLRGGKCRSGTPNKSGNSKPPCVRESGIVPDLTPTNTKICPEWLSPHVPFSKVVSLVGSGSRSIWNPDRLGSQDPSFTPRFKTPTDLLIGLPRSLTHVTPCLPVVGFRPHRPSPPPSPPRRGSPKTYTVPARGTALLPRSLRDTTPTPVRPRHPPLAPDGTEVDVGTSPAGRRKDPRVPVRPAWVAVADEGPGTDTVSAGQGLGTPGVWDRYGERSGLLGEYGRYLSEPPSCPQRSLTVKPLLGPFRSRRAPPTETTPRGVVAHGKPLLGPFRSRRTPRPETTPRGVVVHGTESRRDVLGGRVVHPVDDPWTESWVLRGVTGSGCRSGRGAEGRRTPLT